MLTHNVLQEVITLPEASVLATGMGHGLDRSNLLRYARTGRLVARKSGGTWLTTRAALEVLIVELAGETRGRPRTQPAAWAEVTMTPELEDILARIDRLRAELAQQVRSPINDQRQRRALIVEAIYHTNHLEGNQLSLPEVRAVVEAFWGETNEHAGSSQDEQLPRRRRSS